MKNYMKYFPVILFFLFNPLKLMCQVTYTVTVPSGTNDCFIAGDMNGWVPHEMNKLSDNTYSITINEATISQQYKYCSGPSVINYIEKTTSGYDISNRSYTKLDAVQKWASIWQPGTSTAITVSAGSATSRFFHSGYIDSRNIYVWLPTGYNTGKKYSVLYMHDGQMLFNPDITWNHQAWKVDHTLDSLINKDLVQNTIVVGIDNNGNKRESEYFPQSIVDDIPNPEKTDLLNLMPGGAIADNYLKFIVKELKPYIDENYSTYTDQQHTFIGGSSLGGLITLYALCSYPDIFSGAICMSSHWIGTFYKNTEIPSAIIKYLNTHTPDPSNHKIYFDHGTLGLDSLYAPAQTRVDSLMKMKGFTGLNYKSLIFKGGDHNESSWSVRFNIPALFILANDNLSSIETTGEYSYTLYPNPAKDIVYINTGNVYGDYVNITDIRGNHISVQKITGNKINISSLADGMYIVQYDDKIFKMIKKS